jgi:hypothetical protein
MPGDKYKALLRWDMPADWDAQRRAFEALG